jgi:hypothetical protein
MALQLSSLMNLTNVKQGDVVTASYEEMWHNSVGNPHKRIFLKGSPKKGEVVLYFYHNYLEMGESESFAYDTKEEAVITGIIVADWHNQYEDGEKRTKIVSGDVGHSTIKVEVTAPPEKSVTFTAVIIGQKSPTKD